MRRWRESGRSLGKLRRPLLAIGRLLLGPDIVQKVVRVDVFGIALLKAPVRIERDVLAGGVADVSRGQQSDSHHGSRCEKASAP